MAKGGAQRSGQWLKQLPSRESFWDEKVRQVPIYVRREERRGHEHVPQLQWCMQGDASPEAEPVSTKLSKKVTDWMSKQRWRSITALLQNRKDTGSCSLSHLILHCLVISTHNW